MVDSKIKQIMSVAEIRMLRVVVRKDIIRIKYVKSSIDVVSIVNKMRKID